MGTYLEYQTLVARCGSWSVEDLGDLLHEIDKDRELGDAERAKLQSRVYGLIWDRAQPRLAEGRGERSAFRAPAGDEAEPA